MYKFWIFGVIWKALQFIILEDIISSNQIQNHKKRKYRKIIIHHFPFYMEYFIIIFLQKLSDNKKFTECGACYTNDDCRDLLESL